MSKYSPYIFPGNDTKKTITISRGNNKLGGIPNTSFPVIDSCPAGILCTKGCYAYMYSRMYTNSLKAYQKNYQIYCADPDLYFNQLKHFLCIYSPKRFRYMVSGDIPTLDYLYRMNKVALDYPKTIFTVYSKQYGFLSNKQFMKERAVNLNVFASAWPNMKLPKVIRNYYRIAWMQDGKEDRIPQKVIVCRGSCSECSICYNLKITKDIVFYKHK